MPDNSVDSIVTDPPYALTAASRNGSPRVNDESTPFGRTRLGSDRGFMGKTWDASLPTVETWREVLRVAKPGAHLLSFGGTRTFHRLICNIEDAGWEIRDCVLWIHSQGFPKCSGTTLKPSWEPITLARKAIVGTVTENVEQFGTGALAIDRCRIGRSVDDRFEYGVDGDEEPSDSEAHGKIARVAYEPHEAGRWPANLVLDERAAEMLDEQSGTTSTVRCERPSDCGGNTWGGTIQQHRGARGHTDSGGASRCFFVAGDDLESEDVRFRYVSKASRAEREAGLRGVIPCAKCGGLDSIEHKFSTGKVEKCRRNNHATVKPVALARWLCRLITPPGGRILDCYAGSGSHGVAAVAEGFEFVGIEQDARSVLIARARIAHASMKKGETK